MSGAKMMLLTTMRKEIGDKRMAVNVRMNFEDKASAIDPTRAKRRMMNLEGRLEEDEIDSPKFLLVGGDEDVIA